MSSYGSTDFAPVTFDPNVWYHISEGRVDNYTKPEFTSSLQIVNMANGTLHVWPAVEQYWQLQPVDDTKGRYALRNSQTGVFKQLAVCYNPTEIASSKTQPCMRDSDGSESQMWDIADWGDETLRFVNVDNGTDFVLDVHPGNPIFMSDDLRTDIPQPAQHWLMTSVRDVDDGAFSTTFTNLPTQASSEATTTADSTATTTSSSDSSNTATSSPSSSSSGLSHGAAAGIGVGVGLGVLILGLAAFILWRRRRKAATRAPELAANDKAPPMYSGGYYPPPQELPTPENVVEVQGNYHSELDSTPVGSSMASSPEMKKMTPTTYQAGP